MTFLIVASMALLAIAALAVVAYCAKRTFGFLLLMLAVICYVVPRVAYLGSGLFFSVRGWNTSGAFRNWLHSSGVAVLWTSEVVFAVLLIAALVLFIREGQSITRRT